MGVGCGTPTSFMPATGTAALTAQVTTVTAHGESCSANVLSVNNFALILKNKMAAIANYLKIIQML